jgi:16S rRNA A1518/A1519 N6-dimethyltransferase RsmA/KsgA/DIM1 with predicted DNA glycosylase/AP lyase activity
MNQEALVALADPSKGQYFLTAPDKLALLIDAAAIRPSDKVVEVGAGVGTIAQVLPPSASLTLVEFDGRLINSLKRNVPHAVTLKADGVALLRERVLTCDVLLSNLPHWVTPELIALLPNLEFRTAVISMGSTEPLDALAGELDYSVLTSTGGDDFTPPQPTQSLLVRVSKRTAEKPS